MEGDGGEGGVVAVVEGLQYAGLAVTLLSRHHRVSGQPRALSGHSGTGGVCSPNQACQTFQAVDTATETTARDGIVPNDTMYKSTYQVAHCRPGYPSVRLNRYTVQAFQHNRSSTSRSPDEEAFVESLRKYPMSPVRSRSTDLQRILTCTQSRNGSRYKNTRSAKSLPSKEPLKHLNFDEIPTRDTGITTKDLKSNYGYKRDVELMPTATGSRKSKVENQIGMYDYLKSNHKGKKLKGTEIRYLTDVKQCIRKRLRQICDEDDAPKTICPNIQSRYYKHKRQCQKANVSPKSDKCTTCEQKITQDKLQNDVQISPSTSQDCKETIVSRSLPLSRRSKACFCNRPEPCDCSNMAFRSRLKQKISPEYLASELNKHKQRLCVCENESKQHESYYIKQLKKTVLDWLQELPVYPNFSTDDAQRREVIIKQLIDTLAKLEQDKVNFEIVEYEIKKYLKLLPMWRPGNNEDQESFENQLVQNLVTRIKKILYNKDDFKEKITKWIDCIQFASDTVDKEKIINELTDKFKYIAANRSLSDEEFKEALKSGIASVLNKLPVEYNGSREIVINNLADKLIGNLFSSAFQDIPSAEHQGLRNIVLHWVNDILQISDDLNNEDNVLVNDLITRLHKLQSKDIDNRQEQINDEIIDWLNSVEKNKKCRIERKEILTRNLMSSLLNAPQKDVRKKNINNIVRKWYNNIPDSLGVNMVDNRRDLEILATKLQELLCLEDEKRRNIMRQEIFNWFKNVQKRQGRYIDSETQENLVNKLMSMINDDSEEQHDTLNNSLITQNICEWLEFFPELKQNNKLDSHMIYELSEKLQTIKDKKGELTEYDIKIAVSNWFEKLFRVRGLQVDVNYQKQLLEKLLSVFCPITRDRYQEKPNNFQELLSEELSNIMKILELPLTENQKERLKDQIIQAITQDSDSIKSDILLSRIKNVLIQCTNLPETHAISLAQTLINKIKETLLPNLSSITENPKSINPKSKNKIKCNIESILKILQINNKRQIIDKITDIIAKNYSNDKNGSTFEEICEVLKQANVNDSKAQELTNQLLEMSYRCRNELNDTMNESSSNESGESLWIHKQMFMQRLEREITDFMEKVLNESSSFYKDKTSEDSIKRYDQFKNPPFKTSTPTKSESVQNVNNESVYKSQIKEIIRKWITSLDVYGTVDENFKNEMASDIATDILDRQRYIQLSKTKRSSQEELEHLKYQVFKWTSKLPNFNNLNTTTSQIKMLIKSLGTIDIPDLIPETMKQGDTLNDNFTNIIAQDAGEAIEKKIYNAIKNWFTEIYSFKPKNSQDKHITDEVIGDLSNKLKKLLLDLDLHLHEKNIEDMCKSEIVNCLRKLDNEQKLVEELQKAATKLMIYLKSLDFFTNILEQKKETENELRKKDTIKRAIQNWCKKLPVKRSKTNDDMKDVVDKLGEAVSNYLLVTDIENLNKNMDEILSNLRKLILQFDEQHSKKLPEFTEKLIETLNGVLNDSNKYYSRTIDDTSIHRPTSKKAVEVMYDNIQYWCENLPLHLDNTNKGIEEIYTIRQNLAAKLMKKVGEINLDPEIFHDDYLYEEILRDEIQKVLNTIPKTKELDEVFPTLIENLIKDLLEAKEGMKNEIAGYAYKQQLRDAISKTFSSIGLSITEQTPFEVLKDNLADAFISLHYVGDDEDLKMKLKDKIFSEVNKFCSDYLKRNPSSTLNPHQLNEELYNALKKVPMPKDESLRREVEHIRIKNLVSDWFNDLPLEVTLSHVQKNKIMSMLAKRLLEIENEAEANPDIDINKTMDDEISNWLKKFKVKPSETSTDAITKKLINKLKTTKHTRKLNETTIRTPLNYADLSSDINYTQNYPPSTLSREDQAHLQRIKVRASVEGTISKPDDRKDASVSPLPIATGIQTEDKRNPDNYTFQKTSENASIQTINQNVEIPTPITPQVVIKEYYWDSHLSPTMQRSGSLLSYTHPTVSQLSGNTQQQSTFQEISNLTEASQTLPLPTAKAQKTSASNTQKLSEDQEITKRIQNTDTVGTSTEDPRLAIKTAEKQLSNEINIDSHVSHNHLDDYLQSNLKKKGQNRPCLPCRGRAMLSGKLEVTPEAGTSKAFHDTRSPAVQQMGKDTNERVHIKTNKLESWPRTQIDGQENIHQPWFRRPVYQAPSKDSECLLKRKRRNQQPCTCKNYITPKCTIRPRSPCQYSNKSCYVAKKHCPKCWDGFCPHPSYLYFTQD